MKNARCCLSLLFVLFTLSAAGQTRVRGRITDDSGKSVEYVNVGIENSQTGVTSDGRGHFSLIVPDSLAEGTLYISHLTYEPRRIPLRELLWRPTEPVVVELSERAFAIPQITVRPGRLRYRRVGGRGVRVPGDTKLLFTDRPNHNVESMAELGTALNIREPLLIQTVSFPIGSCTDSLLLRVNLYRLEADSVTVPLHSTPFYVYVLPGWEGIYEVDVSSVPIVARPGRMLVVFEHANPGKKPIEVSMPFYFGESLYRRSKFETEIKKLGFPFHIGLQVYGRVLPE